MGCEQSAPANVPSKRAHDFRNRRIESKLAAKSVPSRNIKSTKISSTVYRLNEMSPILQQHAGGSVQFASAETIPSPPSSPQHSNEARGGEPQSPGSPPLFFEANKPFRVTDRLKQLYEKLKYRLGPLEEDEITHDEERQDALLIYGQLGGTQDLGSLLELLNAHSDNLFLHKLGWEACCGMHRGWLQKMDDANRMLAAIVAAFYSNEAHFFGFSSAQSCAVRLLYIIFDTHYRAEQGGANAAPPPQQQPWEVYLDTSTAQKRGSGVAILCMLLHTYVVNRVVFNFHFHRMQRAGGGSHDDAAGGSTAATPSSSETAKMYAWAQAWLARYDAAAAVTVRNDKDPGRPASSTSPPPATNVGSSRAQEAADIQHNALETYSRQVLASQALYARLKDQAALPRPAASQTSKYVAIAANDEQMDDTPNQYVVDRDLVRALEFNRSDPHIFIQLYHHWRMQKYTPGDLVDLNAMTCVLSVLNRLDPEHIIYGSGMVASIIALVYMMEGPNAFERLIRKEKDKLLKEKADSAAKAKKEERSRAVASHVLISNARSTDKALHLLANAGSTIHDAFIWADTNFELFPPMWTRDPAKGGNVSIFQHGLPNIFYDCKDESSE